MQSDITTVAQVGCGYWGPNLLRTFSSRPDCRVKWVAELSPARREYVSRTYPATNLTDDWLTVLDDPEVDAVVIATPASTHCALAHSAIEAGKHVFVEKPLAMSTDEVDSLMLAAQLAGRTLMVGHTFLYNGAVRYMKQLIDDGELGDIFYVYTQRLNLGQVRSDVNAWWNLAPHDVSILLYLMGSEMPIEVSGRGVDYIQPGVEDVVFATLTWANRVTAHVHVSWLDPGKTRKVTVVGSRKMIVYDDLSDDKIMLMDKGVDLVPRLGERMDYDSFSHYQLIHRAGDVHIPKLALEEPLRCEAEHFLECVRTGRQPLTGAAHAREVVQVLEAVDLSLQNDGRSIPLQAVVAA